MIKILLTDRKVQLIMLVGFIIQLLTCIIQTGFYHADQFYQIIDFSEYQLGNENFAKHIWEFDAQIRPSLQIHLFSFYHKLCLLVRITDPYTQLTLLRVLNGLLLFTAFNLITLYYLKNFTGKILIWGLIMVNFSWLLPYTRTLYSSEMVSSVLFFIALVIYDAKKEKVSAYSIWFITGILLAFSFYARFQMAFAMLGFGIWMMFFDKKWKNIFIVSAGFIAGFAINLYLDKLFYHDWILTPLRYFEVNIMEGKAAQFGRSTILTYILGLLFQFTIIPFSLVLFYFGFKNLFKNYRHYFLWSIMLFLIGHSLVSHKEERFLFPIINIWPVIIAWGLPDLIRFFDNAKKWVRDTLKVAFALTIAGNFVLLIIYTTIPWAQDMDLGRKLTRHFKDKPITLYCIQDELWHMWKMPMYYYQKKSRNIEVKLINNIDSLHYLKGNDIYVAAAFSKVKRREKLMDSLGFKPYMYSNKISWKTNELLFANGMSTIADVWIVYKKE